jgi:2-hydroxy-6-oxonona-2,4-dienedioate hydrolase
MNSFKEPLYSQSYIDTGKGRPVILLHGLFGNITMWRSTINALRSTNRVIIPRLPLFDVPVHRANVKHFVEILHEFLEWHRLKDVVLVGTDIGGQIALSYAYEHPDRVRKIVLSGSSGLFENFPPFDRDYEKDYYSVHDRVAEAFFKQDLVKPNVVGMIHEAVNTYSKGLHISAIARSSRESEITHFLHKLKTPVLLVWGLQDKITPPRVALHFHDLLRYGNVKFLDECGHLPMIEQPEKYVQAVTRFLNDSDQ